MEYLCILPPRVCYCIRGPTPILFFLQLPHEDVQERCDGDVKARERQGRVRQVPPRIHPFTRVCRGSIARRGDLLTGTNIFPTGLRSNAGQGRSRTVKLSSYRVIGGRLSSHWVGRGVCPAKLFAGAGALLLRFRARGWLEPS